MIMNHTIKAAAIHGFISLIYRKLPMIDYHIHTPLCNHAQGSMKAYIHQAISLGFSEICFLDHLILDGPGKKNSMDIREVPLYMQAIACLKHEFHDRITLRAGLEVDFIPEKIPQIKDILEGFNFDVIGASVHFVMGYNVASRREAPPKDLFDKQEIALRYFEQLDRMLDYDFFDVICHPDIVKKCGIPIPENCGPVIDDILTRISKKNLTLEFNAGGWDHPVGDSYPSEELAIKCHQKNIAFTLGSDAHRPEHVGKNIDKSVALLKKIGYTHVNTFEGRLVRPVPLGMVKCPILS
ncbi:MAG: histidinol-phosphatase [Proteobacteria bacterium]|nr:histidinol-phosphatase [Pseudomonadota bacterium]